ncbi:MAG: hypothetical protein A2Z14_09090 [Chloroflexi bacterium RBG_16_48_8]|nr:MAG: hypothetical protein A2Z14_09090 [Chloroflexi bacterium RBG_16_48_8]
MEEALVIIEENQYWIYLGLGLSGLIYLRIAIKRYQEYRSTFFSLERDRARGKFIQSVFMLVLVAVGLLATFIAATFAAPAVPITARPTVLPTVSLLTTPKITIEGEEVEATVTPMGGATPEGLGCSNPKATITSPQDGDSISGIIDVLGAADIPGFAFYKVEIRSLGSEAIWQAIGAGSGPICESCAIEELLARWDTSLVTAGDYLLRLTVMDSVGNAPLPCELRVRVLPSE